MAEDEGITQHVSSDAIRHDINLHFDPTLYTKPEAVIPLYEGASVSLLEAISQHLDWFTSQPGTSKESLSHILRIQHHSILPTVNLLPDSYESLMKVVSPFLIQPITFHACQNDYILYRNYLIITFHLLNHVVEAISRLGPVYGTWMYPFERFNS